MAITDFSLKSVTSLGITGYVSSTRNGLILIEQELYSISQLLAMIKVPHFPTGVILAQ